LRQLTTPFILCVLLCGLLFQGTAQSHTLNLTIDNQAQTQIILGWLKGDDFTKMDSTNVKNGQITFIFPENAHPGVYRLLLGKTTYSKVMNEAPQQFDFIFNNEDIVIKTDFNAPLEKLDIVSSKENKLWHSFLAREKEYNKKFTIFEKELNIYWKKNDTTNALSLANDFNRLQMEWDLRLSQTVQQNNELYASKVIAISRKPILDGFLSQAEREKQLKTEFFNNTNFSNEALIYSSAYTDKIFEYLVLYNDHTYTREKRTEEYIKAIDTIRSHIRKNSEVSAFITSYLIHGFELLKMDELIKHIQEN